MRRLLIAAGLLAFAATLILSLVQAHAGRGEKEYVPIVPIVSPDGQGLGYDTPQVLKAVPPSIRGLWP